MTDQIRHTLLLALSAASVATATSAAPPARPVSPSNYQCEGSAGMVASNLYMGSSRSEWPIRFGMRVDRAAGTVMIFGVSGTTVIKPGRHSLASDGGRLALSWNWNDQANVSQPVTMTMSRSGEFEGAWNQTDPTAKLGAVFGGIFGQELGDAVRMGLRGTFSGVCWQ